ncbi:hypothetical protein Glove_88g36 [Diversispora epigaea]|uniref:Uncharacterized protein n=1 Tax=Diversispora epigaea TaxID=1348612 RepID=A0A397JGF0_9GLOM|nr:hypothetical protein Glove_88g36 [Diversispora epigaea]
MGAEVGATTSFPFTPRLIGSCISSSYQDISRVVSLTTQALKKIVTAMTFAGKLSYNYITDGSQVRIDILTNQTVDIIISPDSPDFNYWSHF